MVAHYFVRRAALLDDVGDVGHCGVDVGLGEGERGVVLGAELGDGVEAVGVEPARADGLGGRGAGALDATAGGAATTDLELALERASSAGVRCRATSRLTLAYEPLSEPKSARAIVASV